jgi:O-antigen ligase
LYVFAEDVGFFMKYEVYSNEYFGKGIDGRSFIWPDLLLRIFENPWFGHCSNCSTEYFDNILSTRNLSSHNTFLELLFRGGIFILILVISLFWLFFVKFRRATNANNSGRFGFAYLLSVLLFMNSNEFGLTQTFTANFLFWCTLGTLYSRSDIRVDTGQVTKIS